MGGPDCLPSSVYIHIISGKGKKKKKTFYTRINLMILRRKGGYWSEFVRFLFHLLPFVVNIKHTTGPVYWRPYAAGT